jgi:hypothetical protein
MPKITHALLLATCCSLRDRIAPALSDEKDSVKYTAAVAIVHLSDVAERRNHKKK